MWRDAWLTAGKDIRVEVRSRVTTNHVAPFALLVLILFAFALDPARLPGAAAGLFWLAVLFSAVLAVHRSFSIETAGSPGDGLRVYGMDPAGVFFGKAAAIVVQLLALELALGLVAVFLYGAHARGILVMAGSAVAATIGLAAVGTLYGALSCGTRVKETLLPLLFLPVVAPVLIAVTKAWQVGLGTSSSRGEPWLELLAVFAVVYTAVGAVAFGPLVEE
jgi:heme exporter protein B